MTDPVTLDELAALDDEISRLHELVDAARAELTDAQYNLATARARQHRAVEQYNADAARPL